MNIVHSAVLAIAALALSGSVFAQEALIRKNLVERLPKLPKIDEVQRSPIAGLYEVRYGGTEILYTDEKGDYVFVNGSMVDTKTRNDLTAARIDKLLAIDFEQLPIQDAMVIKQGSGARRMAVFVDPNCGYCKRFERDLAGVKDVTIYTFLIPILGPDSNVKARDIWCSKQSSQVWREWMLKGVTPPKAMGACDATALDRNLEFAHAQRITGTPSVFFTDGTRKPGAIPPEAIEKLLVASTAAKK